MPEEITDDEKDEILNAMKSIMNTANEYGVDNLVSLAIWLPRLLEEREELLKTIEKIKGLVQPATL